MNKEVTISQIFDDLAFCILLIATYIGMFTIEPSNGIGGAILLFWKILFLIIFYFKMIYLGDKIESYLIKHNVLKENIDEE